MNDPQSERIAVLLLGLVLLVCIVILAFSPGNTRVSEIASIDIGGLLAFIRIATK